MIVLNRNLEFLAIATNHTYSGEMHPLPTIKIYLTEEIRDYFFKHLSQIPKGNIIDNKSEPKSTYKDK